MDALGTQSPIVTQTLPKQFRQVAPALAKPSAPQQLLPLPGQGGGETGFDVQAAEQRRYEAVRKAAQDVANVFIVSDKRFTIFKDSTGQYITRFTSLRDGRVTYIPEPQLLRQSGASVPTIKINA